MMQKVDDHGNAPLTHPRYLLYPARHGTSPTEEA